MKQRSHIDEPYELVLPCIRVEQPMGAFFVASIDAKVLRQITYSDIRRLRGEREVETYLGIQREVDRHRVRELERYVNTIDACFPTSVILAISGECAEYDDSRNTLTLRSSHGEDGTPNVSRIEIAKVLDGQHRIEGLRGFKTGVFQVNVSIFVDMDIANQAYLFSVVNLAQTKVKKSLVYDLFEYARSRSPQKVAHNIAVALDQVPESPFHHRIKRLGSATPGRKGETLTQANFVEAVLPFMSADVVADRDLYMRGKSPARATPAEERELIFRNLLIDEKDMEIADILMAYFNAIREKWPVAWNPESGYMLGKSNGFRALMRLLRPAYLALRDKHERPTKGAFSKLFVNATLKNEDFVITEFVPGTSGETKLFRSLRDQMFPGPSLSLF